MRAKTIFAAALSLIVITGSTIAQEKWSVDPRITQVYPSGVYAPLPQFPDNVYNPNHNVKVVKTFNGTYLINPNFRIHPSSNTTQSEVIICRHPLNQSIMFAASNAVSPIGGYEFISEGIYVTTNSGLNWYGSDSVHSPILSGHGGDPGPTIDKDGRFIISHLGYPTSGVFANYSTNNGIDWSSTSTVAIGGQDKNFSGTDDAPSSPYYGRSYTAWTWFGASSPYIAFSYTTNGGANWSGASQVNNPPAEHYSHGVDIRVGPSGQVYLTWAGALNSGYTEDFDGFAVSTNGGVNWTVTENAFDANGIRGYLATKGGIRVNSFPRIDVDRSGGSRNGWIYIVGCDKNLAPAGSDPDIILHRSADGGLTWSSAIRVNQDPLNNGAIQFFPAIKVDEGGGVNVIYYDDRNVGSNLVEVYISRSTDGGSTWSDILITDHNFAPQPISGIGGGYSGDYIGITSGNGKIWPVWMDRYLTGYYQIWTTWIEYGLTPAHDIIVGPFLSLPAQLVVNTAYDVKVKLRNGGTSNETNVPVRFFINGALISTINKDLLSGQFDSVSNIWTPTAAGSCTLMYASGLTNDTNRTNDTIRTTVQVMPGPLQTLFFDPFNNTSNWTITNNGGNCDWILELPRSEIQLPPTASGTCIASDADSCGPGAYANTTVTMVNSLNCSGLSGVFVEFDCDFYKFANDTAKMDISIDGGNSWTNVFTWTTSRRGEHISIAIPRADNEANVKFRFTSIEPGWNWWWAVDNFNVKGYGYIGIVNNQNEVPNEYSLMQNYPNPFNPKTKIKFSLPFPSKGGVKLVIYDLLGRQVASLIPPLWGGQEGLSPGTYEVEFDGTNYPSGVYFYKLTAGSFMETRKMVLIK